MKIKEFQVIHNAAMSVLENTGIRIKHKEAIQLLIDGGAEVDNSGRLLISRKMVSNALVEVKKRFKLWHSDFSKFIEIAWGKNYFGCGSDALFNVDKKTLKIRRSTFVDVVENMRILDKLDNFDFVMSTALPKIEDQSNLYASIFATMCANTTKPIVTTATNLGDIKKIYRLSQCIGKNDKLAKPFFIAYLEPISPLIFEDSVCDRLLFCAEKNIPLMFAAGANCGGGAPITAEGAVVQGTAESLAGLVLAMLKNKNTKFIFGANTSAMDMKTGIVCYGAPEWFRTTAMYADMAKYYNLPCWGTAGCSDSHCIDAQAGMEAYEGILMAIQSKSTLVHDVGFLGHGNLYDARMLVLTDEMIARAKKVLKPIDVSDNALAINAIDDVAKQNGMYLAHEHTLRNFKSALWLPPKYIDRRTSHKYSEHDICKKLQTEVNDLLK